MGKIRREKIPPTDLVQNVLYRIKGGRTWLIEGVARNLRTLNYSTSLLYPIYIDAMFKWPPPEYEEETEEK